MHVETCRPEIGNCDGADCSLCFRVRDFMIIGQGFAFLFMIPVSYASVTYTYEYSLFIILTYHLLNFDFCRTFQFGESGLSIYFAPTAFLSMLPLKRQCHQVSPRSSAFLLILALPMYSCGHRRLHVTPWQILRYR